MKHKKQTVSVVIIARNEQERIESCIRAVSFADEVIVVDNHSTDKTATLASSLGAIVLSAKTDNFARLRNEGAQRAKGDWLLYIDADETVTASLRDSIQMLLEKATDPNVAGYELFRKNYYFQTPWPGGEWMLRLFRKDHLISWKGKIHESAHIQGEVSRLSGDIVHNTHRTLREMIAKTNEWSETEAVLRFEAHHPPVVWWRVIRVMITGFWDSYIRQGAWRVGVVGLIEAIFQAFSMFATYAKLWEMQQHEQNAKKR